MKCTNCNGTGQLGRAVRKKVIGADENGKLVERQRVVVETRPCPVCNGTGKM